MKKLFATLFLLTVVSIGSLSAAVMVNVSANIPVNGGLNSGTWNQGTSDYTSGELKNKTDRDAQAQVTVYHKVTGPDIAHCHKTQWTYKSGDYAYCEKYDSSLSGDDNYLYLDFDNVTQSPSTLAGQYLGATHHMR